MDVASGSTLTVAKMLVTLLPGLKEVVIRLVLDKKDGADKIVQNNVAECAEGLAKMKEGLKVVVRKTQPAKFKTCMRGGDLRGVDPAEESGAAEASRQKKELRGVGASARMNWGK